jgi:threonine aldolase
VRVATPESNIVMIDLVGEQESADAAIARLQAAGLLVSNFGPRRMRAVTHRDVGGAEIEHAADILRTVLA